MIAHRVMFASRPGRLLVAEQFELKFERIASGSKSQFVKEGLRHPAVSVVTGGAQRTSAQHEWLRGGVKRVSRRKTGRIRVPSNAAAGGRVLFIAKGDKVLPPGRDLALRIQAGFKPKGSAGAEGVVGNVIFAGPEQLDRHVNALGNPCGFDQVVVLEPPAKAASRAHHVSSDVILMDAKRLGYQSMTILRQRTGRPHLQLAVFPVRRSALWLQRDVCNERIFIGGFDDLCR